MSPLTEPTKLTLAKDFTQQPYMWEFPQQHGLWYPGLITTALWLDAADASTITESGGAVSQWDDKSGNGRHASQATGTNQPTYTVSGLNGKSVITFDGLNDSMDFQIGFGTITEFNAIAVWRTDTSVPNNYDYLYQLGDSSNTLSLSVAAPQSNFSAGNYYGLYSSSSAADFNTPAVFNAAKITSHGIGTGTAHNFWVNGAARTVPNWPQSLNATTSNSAIGRYIGADANFLKGYIAEIVFTTNATLSTANRQKLEGYLAHKWGLTANLPAGHPYKTVGPTP